MNQPETDTRNVHGARCTWWDAISESKTGAHGLPGCPHCGGVLYEVATEAQWWEAIDRHDKHEPGYRALMEWARGNCYPNFDTLKRAYALYKKLEKDPDIKELLNGGVEGAEEIAFRMKKMTSR